MSPRTTVSPAALGDVPSIQALVAAGVLRGHLLPRSGAEIRQHLHRWVVARRGRRVVGCLSLEPTEPTLWEVRSVCVAEGLRGHGLGNRLVAEAIRRGVEARVPRLFAVTAAHALFDGAGFQPLPQHAPEWAYVLRPIRPCYQVRIADLAALVPRPDNQPFLDAPHWPRHAESALLLQRRPTHGLVALAE